MMEVNWSHRLLIDGLKKYGLDISDKQLADFDRYYEMLIEKNKVMNLTAITEYEEVVVKHFIDSLAITEIAKNNEEIDLLLNSKNIRLLDLGTGAGFPGIPIKIMFPEIEVTLMDSLNKRVKFLNEVINELNLENIKAIHARAEEFARKVEYREQYDIVVSRAVARMATLTEFCFPYVKLEGYFLPYKSAGATDEIKESEKAVSTLGGIIEKTELINLPGTDIIRMVPIVKKVKTTPIKYPRLGKKAETNPIKH